MKRLLLLTFSVFTFIAASAADKVIRIENFDYLEVGTKFKVYGSAGAQLSDDVASATVVKDPRYSFGNILHVKVGSTPAFVEFDIPNGLTGSKASEYERIAFEMMRPFGQTDRFQGSFVVSFGTTESLRTAFADIDVPVSEENKLKTSKMTYSIKKVSSFSKKIRIGFTVRNTEYYIDELRFLTTDFKYDYTDVEQTARYHAEKLGKSIGVCVNPNQLNDSREGQTIYRNFNMVVGENAMKFDATEPRRNSFNFSSGDQIVNWALKHDMQVRGHTLAWHSQTAQWVHDTEYSKKEMLSILKNHIFKVVGHWKGKITEWDVVNEVLAENQGRGVGAGYDLRNPGESVWYRRCGEEFIDSAFVWAHQADPDAILYINDYNIGHWENHYESGKTHAMYNLVKRLLDDGIPVHGVGMQMHTSINGLNVSSIEKTIKEFQTLGVKCIITELDMPGSNPSSSSEQRVQATKYAGLVDIVCRYDNAPTFVVWGIADDRSWLENSEQTKPLLFDPEMAAKPAYISVVNKFKEYAVAAGNPSIEIDDHNPLLAGDDVYNIMGQKVATSVKPADIHNLPTGLYIYRGKKVYVE